VVTAINITDAGFGYPSVPAIQVDPPPVSVFLPDITSLLRLGHNGLLQALHYQLQGLV
jgi:hypothetical protein